ncbi:tripartite tricarboxylate transporter substrate binding protein [Defluviitalea raffinosedens]|uniref:Tripartite tricarboxylate transporter substrate binding protein n=1 Tax=Defluviitalea raffinosedens TaxID=1450156 RepID=A0A7C8HF01_9FIRM|nr:tripartite tricarboxylate transporter substrate-binding protein [Defluviitalea raffinosedens]KAE9634013.1 tripartite tricarboxylate transporter substrate binding protein [Defluviitalea raffinosedens]
MKIKKQLAVLLTGVLALSTLLAGCQGKGGSSKSYAPASSIDWMVTSSPGGGSDIFTRMITDIMKTEGIVDSTFVVTNKTDGGGEVGRNEVANLKGDKASNTLLTFNSGDLMPMVLNTKNRSKNFKILAVMALDKQLIFKTEHTKQADFAEAIQAAKNGETIVIGGSKGDDVATYEAMIKEIGVTSDNMKYITYDSTSDAITAGLGGHVDFVISKPAVASEYVEAGSLIPVLALATERYSGKFDAPTLSEIGDYENVEVPVWRGVVGPANMSDEAVAFWSEALKKVSESERWKTEYIDKYKLVPEFKGAAEATEYITAYEKAYMEANGIQ